MTGKRTYAAHAISMLGSWWGIACSVILVFIIHPVPLEKGLNLLLWVFVPTIASEGFKLIIRRPRPAMRGETVKVKAYGYSFPSSHTVAATMLAAWILLVPEIRWWSWLFLTWPIAVGWSRVWLRAHDAIDVAGGIAFGAIWSLLFSLLF
ncbi:MAG: phosphatase PAP2 family protein [Patescibacteria group bacterium]|jgi:undecaprenyl-diphosphatase